MTTFYLVTEQKNKNNLVSKENDELFDYITDNLNVKIKKLQKDGNFKTIDKRKFMDEWYFVTEDIEKLFVLSEILISRKDNQRGYLGRLGLLDQYNYYLNNRNNEL